MTRPYLPFLLLLACGAHAPVAPTAPAPVAPVAVTASATPAPASLPAPHAALVALLLGSWRGNADTPFGEMRFGLDFVLEPDGAVHARLATGPEAYLDFRFHRDRPDGLWLLRFEGALPGLGVQTHTLKPAGALDGVPQWVSEDPSYIVVTIDLDGDALAWSNRVRGEDHATFQLRRVPGVSSR